jgi:sRNA-binding carbon storage regulator CsrA
VAKGSPFATPRQVFFWRSEIIRKIQDIDREDSPQLKEKIIDASWADFHPLSFQ